MSMFSAIFKADNPITRLALRRLRAGIGKHAVGWGLLISLIGVIVIIGLPMSLLPPIYLVPKVAGGYILSAAEFGLIVWQEVVKQVISVGGGILLAIVAINLLREGTSDLLHTTPYSARQIRFAMLGAVLRYLLIPLVLVTLTRGLFIWAINQHSRSIGENLTLPTSMLTPDMLRIPLFLWRTVGRISEVSYEALFSWTRQVRSIRYPTVWPLWAAYFIVQPVWDTLLYGLIGLAVVSRTRNDSNRLPIAIGLIGGLWVAGFVGERLVDFGLTWPRGSWANIRWFPGIPAMSGGYIGGKGLFGLPMMAVVIGVKLVVMGLAARASGNQPHG